MITPIRRLLALSLLVVPGLLAAAHVAPLNVFSNGTVADAAKVNANFRALEEAIEAGPPQGSVGAGDLAADAASLGRVSGEVLTTNGTSVGLGTSAGNDRLTVAGSVLADRYALSCDARVKLAFARSYATLNAQLDDDMDGATACGAGWHVCNYDEATIYGTALGCDLGGQEPWIVGGFSNLEYHRRAIWNGQDQTQCRSGWFPSWVGRYEGYLGRVHCRVASEVRPVACCVNL